MKKHNKKDQIRQLKQQLKQLEHLVAELNLDIALRESYARIACKKAGITDIEDFKNKVTGDILHGAIDHDTIKLE